MKSRMIAAKKSRVRVKKHFINLMSEQMMIAKMTNGIINFLETEITEKQQQKLVEKVNKPNASEFEYTPNPKDTRDQRNYDYCLWQYTKDQLEKSRPYTA